MALDCVRIFGGLEIPQSRPLIAAVSGGSDSLALLLLLHDYARLKPAVSIHAVTVDHGLRPEAAAEAAMVADFCRSLGIPHRTVHWVQDKPRSGIIAAARHARYHLLADAARAVAASAVLCGHTMDDQAETVAMRAARGEGAGLAGMAAATLFDEESWIIRPILGVRRGVLRHYLTERGVTWVDDPSNANMAFERVRTRARLSDADVESLADTARQAGIARTSLADQAGELLHAHVTRPSPGLLRVEPAMIHLAAEGASPAAILAMRLVLAVSGGTTHMPEADRVASLCVRLSSAGPMRATLSRAVIDMRAGGAWVRREARDLPETELNGRRTLWDGRFRIISGQSAARLHVGAAGAPPADDMTGLGHGVPASLVRAARALEPAIFAKGDDRKPGSAAYLCEPKLNVRPLIAPFAEFLPGFDLSLDRSMRAVLGMPPQPASPWKHHIEPKA